MSKVVLLNIIVKFTSRVDVDPCCRLLVKEHRSIPSCFIASDFLLDESPSVSLISGIPELTEISGDLKEQARKEYLGSFYQKMLNLSWWC
jgi:hypothetical protein